MQTQTRITAEILWSEHPFCDMRAGEVFPTIEHLSAYLTTAGGPDGGGYYKTGFRLVSPCGEEYTGRFDIGCDADTLRAHVEGFCRYVSKPDAPAYLRQETREAGALWLQLLQDDAAKI